MGKGVMGSAKDACNSPNSSTPASALLACLCFLALLCCGDDAVALVSMDPSGPGPEMVWDRFP